MDILSYIKNLNRIKEQAAGRWSGLSSIERDVLDGSYEWLVENLDIKKGELIIDEDLVRTMDDFLAAVVDVINNVPRYQSNLSKFLGDLGKISSNNEKFHATTNNFDIDIAGVNDVQKAVIGDIIDQYTGNGLNAHFAAPLKENVFRNMLAGANMQDVKKVLESYIMSGKDQSGKLASYIDQTAMQAVDTYTGAINQKLMEEFTFTGMIISGSLIETSSKQCILAVEKSIEPYGYLPFDEWEKILEVARNNPKARLIAGTTIKNLPINKLHWGCRHDFTPVIMEVPKSGDLPQPKEEPTPTPPPAKTAKKAPVKTGGDPANKTQAKQRGKDLLQNAGFNVSSVTAKGDLELPLMNKINNQLGTLLDEYNIHPAVKKDVPFQLLYQSTSTARQENGGVLVSRPTRIPGETEIVKLNVGSRFFNRDVPPAEGNAVLKRWFSKVDDENKELDVVTHEFTHFMSISRHESFADETVKDFWPQMNDLRKQYSRDMSLLTTNEDWKKLDDIYLGKYASTNVNEFMAEAFTEYKLRGTPSPYALKVGKLIDKYFKK